ncbi:MAG: hypothetical protein ACPGPE_02520, partial [Planctomycetota bacterium]
MAAWSQPLDEADVEGADPDDHAEHGQQEEAQGHQGRGGPRHRPLGGLELRGGLAHQRRRAVPEHLARSRPPLRGQHGAEVATR